MAFVSSIYADWGTLSIAAASLSVIVSAMLIMLSRLFSMPNFEQIAKTEFVYAASTVFIVIMVIAIVQYVEVQISNGDASIARCLYLSSFQCRCDAPGHFGGDTAMTLIDWMKLYLKTPTYCVDDFMNVLYALSIPVEATASMFLEIFMSEHASGFGMKWIAERITNATQSFSFYMYMFYLINYILDFVKYYAGFFFSIGVVLRAFPPTRGAGAYLMAIAFGLYFVFPLAYILISSVSLQHTQSDVIAPIDGTTFLPGEGGDASAGRSVCTPNPEGSVNYICALPQVTDMTSRACGSTAMGGAFEMPNLIRANRLALQDIFDNKLLSFTKHLTATICILPAVALIILLTFVLNTTNLFGGNIPEIGRGLVKLI
ncbi:hypothetical protein KKF81_02250 [Candidatus Micrarchaeota archaeon]|nr:hypothetical protein [Candidatus Micrarchaeota archaeon]MBU1165741.1 hypothetical protein [Candidatus Micrarchaeota archaeon]MBU1887494.1 hypothetical protein [Candidatus Micrarchaeota archaeon]